MAGLKGMVAPMVSSLITSPGLRSGRERIFEWRRGLRGGKRQIDWVHQVDDPYSHVLAQLIPRLLASYEVNVRLRLVPPPDRAAAPEPEMLAHYGLRDARQLAQGLGLAFPAAAALPAADRVAEANRALAGLSSTETDIDRVVAIGTALWSGAAIPGGAAADAAAVSGSLEDSRRWREKRGHYLGGTLYYGGIWYWGADRLSHLTDRLDRVGARRSGAPGLDLEPRHAVALPEVRLPLEVFFSFRSPYSGIAMERVFGLARRYRVPLELRPVLPMVMRGLPVPTAKRMYIVTDTKREAERKGIPFGRAVDPVGPGVERCLAVTHRLIGSERAEAFIVSAMSGIWAEGIDVATDSGLGRVAERAGVDQGEVAAALADASWRERVEENRAAMFAAGLWGVPSFRLGDFSTWGQDRLWLLEQALQPLAGRATE